MPMRVQATDFVEAMRQVSQADSSEASPVESRPVTAVRRAFWWHLLGRIVRLWAGSWRVQRRTAPMLDRLLDEGPVVLGFWHEHLAILAPLHADRGFVGMVSRSRDGERLTQILSRLGFRTVRGSTSMGARGAARAGLRALRQGQSVAIALDGPRGPRHQVASGAPTLARWAECPLLLVGCHAWPAIRLHSWDRQCLPLPFARITVTYGVCGAGEASEVACHLSELCLSDPSAREP